MILYYFVRPTDSLFVRGNLAFGQSGEHGTGVMPPPPSLFAGAFRSAILGGDAQALAQFTQQGRCNDAGLHAALGSVDKPGAFRIAWLSLAGFPTLTPTLSRGEREPEAGGSSVGETVEAILPLPADLVRLESGFAQVTPGKPNALVEDGRELPRVAVLRSAKQEKPQGGYYLRQSGWLKHVEGRLPNSDNDSTKAVQVHARDPRLGIGLNPDARTAETGLIYTTEGHAFSPSIQRGDGEGERIFAETGFLVGIDGADGLLPESGFLRLGGDGRGAQYRRVDFQPPKPTREPIAQTGRFRLILNTPGLFTSPLPLGQIGREPIWSGEARPKGSGQDSPETMGPGVRGGWLPNSANREGDAIVLRANGFSARLVCAAVPRREVISGWDLFQWKPKTAQRVAPAGSVYWFEDFQGDPGKLAEWVESGLWAENAPSPQPSPQRGEGDWKTRRAEGYNLASLAAWSE